MNRPKTVKIESDFRLTTNELTQSTRKKRVGEKQKGNFELYVGKRATDKPNKEPTFVTFDFIWTSAKEAFFQEAVCKSPKNGEN